MEFYYTVFFIPFIFSVPIKYGNKFFSKFFIIISFIFLFLISIFRVNIGTDYSGHQNAYWGINSGLLVYKTIYLKEFMFYAICKLFGFLKLDYKFVVTAISFFTIYPIYKITDKENYLYIITFFVCSCYLTSFCLMRQFAAISMATCGLYLYLHNKKKQGVVWLILSCGFHNSFVIFIFFLLFALLFGKSKIFTDSKLSIVLLFIIFVVAMFFSKYGIKYLPSSSGYLHYLKTGNSHAARVEFGSGLGVLVRYISYFLLLYINNYSVYSDKEKRGIFNILFFFLIFFDILSLNILIFTRMRYLFYPILFYFPIFADIKITKKNIQNLSFICIILISLSYIAFYKSTAELWGNLPYKAWL